MATHHGFLREFPFIRIDAFDGDPANVNPYTAKAPLFYLLTHAHTDHIVGLDSPHFAGQIYCTPLTKRLLLETMTAADRVREEELGKRVKRVKKFANLTRFKNAKGAGSRGTGMDRIITINYNTPTVISGPGGVSVTVTALDANHCPGSCMWLITGPSTTSTSSFYPSHPNQPAHPSSSSPREASILHTGDLRVESWWLTSLAKNPLVQPYLAPPPYPTSSASWKGKARASDEDVEKWDRERDKEGRWGGGRSLDCIYLDTSSVLLDEELVEKVSSARITPASPRLMPDAGEEAVSSLVELIAQYPPDTRFFLNTWTWGYEEMLKGIHRAFGQEIHLDRYKERIYTSPPFTQFDPLLSVLGTTAAFPTCLPAPTPSLHASTSHAVCGRPKTTPPLRFHACERRWRCDDAWAGGVGCYQWEEEYLHLLEGKKEKKVSISTISPGREKGEPLVVFVNPNEMPKWRWEAYKADVGRRLKRWNVANRDEGSEVRTESDQSVGSRPDARGTDDYEEEPKLPTSLIVPLARHSSLPELQRLVSLFRPRTILPLTLTPPTLASNCPAYEYKQLPSLFGPYLAPHGRARLMREAEQYSRSFGPRRAKSTVLPPSSADVEDEGGLKEPKEDWMEEMRKLGMNVEGGPEAFREVVNWGKRLQPGELTPSPRAKKRKRRDEEDQVEVLVVDTDEEESFTRARPNTKDEEEENFNDTRRNAEFARLPSPFLTTESSSHALLPAAPIDSPFLPAIRAQVLSAASGMVVDKRQRLKSALSSSTRYPRDRDCTPELAVLPPTATASTGRALRKSVTFATSPSSRFSRQMRSALAGQGEVKADSSPELGTAQALSSDFQPVPSGSFNPFPPSTMSAAFPSSALEAFSGSTSSSFSSAGPCFVVSKGPLSSSSSDGAGLMCLPVPLNASIPTSAKLPRYRPPSSPATRARRLAIIAAIQRSLRGTIVGGKLVPFEAGDQRLQGRKPLRFKDAPEKGQQESWNATPKRQALQETQEHAQPGGLVLSPSSFRTVEASTSPLTPPLLAYSVVTRSAMYYETSI
ncbi:hypothetical protein JCM11251_002825 [Rhodosporidiobolus azoricus]